MNEINYSKPTLKQILKACPLLQWRKCFLCKSIGLYRDSTLPECKCHICGSEDTRTMVARCVELHEND